ncbi:type II secretion system protein [Bordetella bronchiseptica]|uniref:type II secretion system protein n=1 Tax=Bordetella bronchiseptica TaxID=518 RepID=UPI00028B3E4D|nr:prepilin-type N-terminal cleavage/methylation domain-containing protein [Bordetella bronchiseptica]CCJ57501.1 hypothetical protein BN115_0745 [Bordetella bronchiseptica MO149]CCN04490.1 hypothetical protein BN116_2698 [Bordetella bronchiseptica Bbr77]CCN17085.1 hypothetical protein BN114_1073 [Bordetella bronchiseptica MO211]AWP57150.1 prepilin-type cleavage/methylation domain-containing protein [Bordetella bronchiseptica]
MRRRVRPGPSMQNRNTARRARAQQGFTLVEISVVLVIIALIIGAVTVGRDVYRNAVNQRMISDFVQPWAMAYSQYVAATGLPPGDDPANPTGRVNAALDRPLCNTDTNPELSTLMLRAGIRPPQGRGPGLEDRYVYQDSQGLPQELQVCLRAANWSEAAATPTTYQAVTRNVMELRRLTPELAAMLDRQVDNQIDARFGRLREDSRAGDLTQDGAPWSKTEANLDNGQAATMTGYLLMP